MGGSNDFKTYVIYSVLGAGTSVGLGYLIKHIIKKFGQNKAQKENLYEGNPSTLATQLYMALGNEHWYSSSNKTEIFNLLRSIPSKDFFTKVQDKYKTNYSSNLSADLEKRLTPEEYNLSVLLIAAKPKV